MVGEISRFKWWRWGRCRPRGLCRADGCNILESVCDWSMACDHPVPSIFSKGEPEKIRAIL